MIPQCKQTKIAGVSGDTLPIGSIVEWGSNVIPNNWLLCNGQAVSRTEYEELFSTIGTIYGSGDGSTTFNLPNFKGRVATGKDESDINFNILGKTGGEKTHTLTIEEMPSHNHNFLAGSEETYSIASFIADNSTLKDPPQETGWRKYENIYIANKGGSQPHNNLQPFVVTNFIIKAHQSAGVVAEVIQKEGLENNTNVYSADAVNRILEKNILTATVESNVNLNQEFTNLNLIENVKIGNKLSIKDGRIKIGSGISKIKVNASVFLEDINKDNISYIWSFIKKNNVEINGAICSGVSVYFQSCTLSDIIIDVQENDTIYLCINNGNYTTHSPIVRAGAINTRLYVEVIE